MPHRCLVAAVASAVVAAGVLFAPGTARAADPAYSEACMKPLPAGSPDPAVRDVHFHTTGGGGLITISACIVSGHANVLQGVAANVGIFSKDGVLLNYAGQSYTSVAPLANPSADGPKLVLLYGVSIEIDGKYGQEFAPDTVVALTSVSCTKPLPDCAPAPAVSATLLLPVQVDQDLAGAKSK
jgi:hypothetical protein